MTREEIIARFEKYDFRDRQGHPLVNCLDFQLLIDEGLSSAELAKKLEKALCERKNEGGSSEN